MYLVKLVHYPTWPHHRLTALLYLYMHVCKCPLFTDEGSRWLPKRLNNCFSVLASATNRSILFRLSTPFDSVFICPNNTRVSSRSLHPLPHLNLPCSSATTNSFPQPPVRPSMNDTIHYLVCYRSQRYPSKFILLAHPTSSFLWYGYNYTLYPLWGDHPICPTPIDKTLTPYCYNHFCYQSIWCWSCFLHA